LCLYVACLRDFARVIAELDIWENCLAATSRSRMERYEIWSPSLRSLNKLPDSGDRPGIALESLQLLAVGCIPHSYCLITKSRHDLANIWREPHWRPIRSGLKFHQLLAAQILTQPRHYPARRSHWKPTYLSPSTTNLHAPASWKAPPGGGRSNPRHIVSMDSTAL
jgi:hypothetical protein